MFGVKSFKVVSVALVIPAFIAGIASAAIALRLSGFEWACYGALLVGGFAFACIYSLKNEVSWPHAALFCLTPPAMSIGVLAAAYVSGDVSLMEATVPGGVVWGIALYITGSMAMKDSSLVSVISVAALVIVAAWFLVPTVSTGYLKIVDAQVLQDSFASHMVEYLANKPDDNRGDPYIRGRIVVLDIESSTFDFDTVFLALPEEMRASLPRNVGTVVWLKRGRVQVGSYTDGAAAFQNNCLVIIIDESRGVIVGRKTILGSKPLTTKQGSGSQSGTAPSPGEIASYLISLPRR